MVGGDHQEGGRPLRLVRSGTTGFPLATKPPARPSAGAMCGFAESVRVVLHLLVLMQHDGVEGTLHTGDDVASVVGDDGCDV